MKLAAVLFCGACLVTAAVPRIAAVGLNQQRLWLGAYAGDLNIVRAELAKGADVNLPLESSTVLPYGSSGLDTGATPLMAALIRKKLQVVKVLVAHGADLARGDVNGWTPMHCAVTGSDETFETFVEAVLASAADPRVLVNAVAPGSNGRTPLHEIVMYHPAATKIIHAGRSLLQHHL